MQPIGKILNSSNDAELQQLRRRASGRTATNQPVDAFGNPVDRTVCPGCRNATFEVNGRLVFARDDCDICRGLGIVCPTCRGARNVTTKARMMGASPMEVCSDCMRGRMEPNTGKQMMHADFKRALWELDEQREIDAIGRYRDRQAPRELAAVGARNSQEVDDVPFD